VRLWIGWSGSIADEYCHACSAAFHGVWMLKGFFLLAWRICVRTKYDVRTTEWSGSRVCKNSSPAGEISPTALSG